MNRKILYISTFLIIVANLVILNFANAQIFGPENLFSIDANTVALWRFNDLSGNVVTDETGINNGTAIGTSIVDGKFGKARYFNGQTDYITVPDNSSLRNFSQLTIEAWVYPTGFDLSCWANAEDIVSKGVDGNLGFIGGYHLRISRNQDGLCAEAGSFNNVNFSGTWHDPNQWYYVVFTYDGSYSKIYVNGVLESSNYTPNLAFITTHPLYINHHLFGGGSQSSQRMRGLIDEIRISNIARSVEEIAYYYNLALSQNDKMPPETEIYFDSDIQQLKIKGIDNITVNPAVSVVENNKQIIYQIQDEAGNITKLFFGKLKQEGKEIKAELKAVQYNNEPIIELPKTELEYRWSLDRKTNTIKELEQRIKVKDVFDIKIKYNHQKDETKIKIKQENKEEIEQTLPGLVVVKLISKSGVLDFRY